MSRTVLITGCSSGFGEATVRLFADRGWNVVATMRSPEKSSDFAQHAKIFVTRLDVQDQASIAEAISQGITRFGRIDVIVNNAGFGATGIFEGIARDKVQEQFDVNVFGVMDVVRAILPHFRSRRAGLIINVSSGVGVFGLPMGSLYTASKFALEGFSEALSYELAAIGVTIKLVEPGSAPDTGFPSRSTVERTNSAGPNDYDDYIRAMGGVFQRFRDKADDNPIAKVAEGIFAAATDRSNQLRYVLTDDIKPFVKARRETSEETYMAFMRDFFDPLPSNV